MAEDLLKQLASALLAGRLAEGDFLAQVSAVSVADLGPAQLDLDRQRRCGFPEVVYGEGKTVPALVAILQRLASAGHDALATRISAEKATELLLSLPQAHYNPVGRTFRVPSATADADAPRITLGRVAVITAGTSDLPVAEEAHETLLWMGCQVTMVHDVGVAGPQRLISQLPRLFGMDAVVVIAGMEAALASMVGGHVACPVIGVPTSVGYGASLGGIAALLGMLNSCAANVTVVNIDAGFKGAYVAGLIARRAAQARGDG